MASFSFSQIFDLIDTASKYKRWIDLGLPILAELQKSKPQVIPVLEQVGKEAFPALADKIHTVAAAAEVLFNSGNTTLYAQRALNRLQNAGLDEDGLMGPATRAATQIFQANHPPLDADGWPGPKTRDVMKSELAKLK